jgi:alpha-glucosidase
MFYKRKFKMIQKLIFTIVLCFLMVTIKAQQDYTLNSPDNNIIVTVSLSDKAYYSISHKGALIVRRSPINLVLDKLSGANPFVIMKESKPQVNQKIIPFLREKRKVIEDNYSEMILGLKNEMQLTFRVYNNGFAYRWELKKEGEVKVLSEEANFNFAQIDWVYFQDEEGFKSHNERVARKTTLDSLTPASLGSLPALVYQNNLKLVVTESDLYDYAGMWLRGNGRGGLNAVFPQFPSVLREKGDRDEFVDKTEDFIAKTKGKRTFPWRIIGIHENDKDILNNQLVYQLSQNPDKGLDFSWVKPGKVAWDWWNYNNITGVDFRAGVNTETYKYYIDFAAKYGIEYIVLDEGWYALKPTPDVTKVVPEINMKELVDYANSKNVGIILWVSWLTLDKQLKPALDLYQNWGVKGIKVDFMQRDDQLMVNYYEKVALQAAIHKLMVDFHGAYKPTGMQRKYPNQITREGIYGLENAKWDVQKKIGPEHNVTVPFVRFFAGPADYTPGAMRNANAAEWSPIFNAPMSLGTRCHQLAMYVVYESPLQMLADSPTNYYKEAECTEFISKVPSVWDETVYLDAKVGDYIAVARQAANGDWFAGAMTDWTERKLEIKCDFLSSGTYEMTVFQDGINADRNANDYKKIVKMVQKGDVLNLNLVSGGGWAARFVKK